MNKFLKITFFFFFSFDLSSNASFEITTIEIQDSYKITQRFPWKDTSIKLFKLAFEIPGKIFEVKVDIGDAVKKMRYISIGSSEMQAI